MTSFFLIYRTSVALSYLGWMGYILCQLLSDHTDLIPSSQRNKAHGDCVYPEGDIRCRGSACYSRSLCAVLAIHVLCILSPSCTFMACSVSKVSPVKCVLSQGWPAWIMKPGGQIAIINSHGGEILEPYPDIGLWGKPMVALFYTMYLWILSVFNSIIEKL